MTITCHGNCHICGVRCSEQRKFSQTINMLNPNEADKIGDEIKDQIIAWRDSDLYCATHEYKG